MERLLVTLLLAGGLLGACAKSPEPQIQVIEITPTPRLVVATPTKRPWPTATKKPTRDPNLPTFTPGPTMDPRRTGRVLGEVSVTYYLDLEFSSILPINTLVRLTGDNLLDEIVERTQEGKFTFYDLLPGEYLLFLNASTESSYFTSCGVVSWGGDWKPATRTLPSGTLLLGYEKEVSVGMNITANSDLPFNCYIRSQTW